MENKGGIEIRIALKHLGNFAKKVKEFPFILSTVPGTLRELIEESVRTCLRAFRERAERAKSLTSMTDEQFASMQEIGKFTFGVHYNENHIDEAQAVLTALNAVKDGLVRVFQGDKEIINIDDKITVNAGDVFTFVKLTMLAGRMW